MTFIFYAYHDGSGQGVRESQRESMKQMQYLITHNLFPVYIVRTVGANNDRLHYWREIWGKDTFINVESNNAPTYLMLKALSDCPEALCSQKYPNWTHYDDKIVGLSSHKIKLPPDIHTITNKIQGVEVDGIPYRYATDADKYCDLTDLGVIKFSLDFQKAHDPPDWTETTVGYSAMLENLHRWLYKVNAPRWHIHPEESKHARWFHFQNNSTDESTYLSEAEYRKVFKLPSL